MVLLLELFKGTGSYSKVAERMGLDIISVDMVEKFKPTILTNILEWDYTTIPIPDIITASPPCETFSILITTHKNKVRDYLGDMRPLTPKGENGDRVLFKTLEIIKYFLEKNPKLKFAIENPRGFMRRMPCMSEEPIKHRDNTWYSMYGMPYRKPTDFWSNIDGGLKLKVGKKKDEQKLTRHIEGMKLTDKYVIPAELCETILTKLIENI
jgi:site-specific DNA-cytosine methylase